MADDEAAGSLQRKSETYREGMEEDDEEEEFFEVERILAKSKFKGVVSYKVRWKDYGSEEDTWEPIDNLGSCKELIDEFDKQREESIRKKAEKRKMRQAVMEGRVSSQESSEEDSLYPPNFKNSFWKDLEAGRIDVFDSNMYSKVKERTVKQLSLKEYQETENVAERKQVGHMVSESANTPGKNNKSPKNLSQKGKGSSSSSSKKKNACSTSSRKTKTGNKDRLTYVSIESDCDSDSDYKCTPVYTECKEGEHSSIATDKAVVERPGIKLIMKLPKPPGEKAVVTDKHGQASSKARPHLKGNKDSVQKQESHETARKRKKKHHKHKHDATKHSHTESKHGEHKDKPIHAEHNRTASASKHTKINHKQTEAKVERRDENTKNTEIEMQHEDISVKHEEKCHKPKEEWQTSVNHIESIKDTNRKRKISEPTELESDSKMVMDGVKYKKEAKKTADSEKITDFKVGKGCDLEGNQKTVCKPEDIQVKTEVFDTQFSINCSLNPTLDTTDSVKNSSEVSDFKEDVGSDVTLEDCVDMNWNPPYCVDGVFNKSNISQPSPTLSAINHTTDCSLDLNHTNGSHDVTHNFDTTSQNYTPTHNFTTSSHNYRKSHGNDDFMSCIITHPVSNTFEDFPLPLLDCNLNTSAGSACVNRRDSETVDSGIASPASEKSLGLSRSEPYNPLDDVLDQSLLPFFPDAETVPEKEVNQDFSIDLDEIDWDLFDCDARLEPITLSNDEFVKAVMTGDFGLVKRAFMGDGKYSLEQVDLSGKTLLVHAAQHGYDDIADLLIEHGANVNTQISNGFTALMTACQFAELSTVNLLIELGAKVNMQTFNGESALMIAVRRGHKHITWLLLESGANFSLKSNAGHTALNYARAFNHVDTESVISTHTQRLMAEFNRQVSFTLNNLANLREMVFPPQVFNISEEDVFSVNFNYTSQLPPIHGLGYLLFLGHAVFTNEEVTCRFYGPCAVKKACLNSVTLSPLTKEGNFVLAFNPVVPGNNVLTVNVTKEADMKGKLIVCAYKAQLV